jgi:predicted tellurium resistance membrane protein TerC
LRRPSSRRARPDSFPLFAFQYGRSLPPGASMAPRRPACAAGTRVLNAHLLEYIRHIYMEWLFDPTIWVGLLTLVVLEIVLGIDNLIFIAILADKLPPQQRDKARMIGLSLAMLMRLGLLSIVSWLVTLTTPLFSIGTLDFSGRGLILLLGGLFLLFKATVELHERLEGAAHTQSGSSVIVA